MLNVLPSKSPLPKRYHPLPATNTVAQHFLPLHSVAYRWSALPSVASNEHPLPTIDSPLTHRRLSVASLLHCATCRWSLLPSVTSNEHPLPTVTSLLPHRHLSVAPPLHCVRGNRRPALGDAVKRYRQRLVTVANGCPLEVTEGNERQRPCA